MRRCRVCKEEKPLSEFDFDKRRNRHATWCKACRRDHIKRHSRKTYAENREKRRADALAYYYKNRDEQLEKKRQRHRETYQSKPKPVWKECKECGRIAPLSAFRSSRGGRFRGWFRLSLCQACRETKQRTYYEANKERYAARGKAWRRRNLERRRPQRNAYSRRYRSKNRVRLNRLARERYYPRRKASIISQNRKRKAWLQNAPGAFDHDGVLAKLEFQGHRCYYCGEPLGEDMHRDHKIPVSRGGANWLANIALTCAFCNVSKGNKTVDEYREYLLHAAASST